MNNLSLNVAIGNIDTGNTSLLLGTFRRRSACEISFPLSFFLVILWQLAQEEPKLSPIFVYWGNHLSVATKNGKWVASFGSYNLETEVPQLCLEQIGETVGMLKKHFLSLARQCV